MKLEYKLMIEKRDRDIALGIYGGDWRLEMLTVDMMVMMVKMIEILTSDRNNVIKMVKLVKMMVEMIEILTSDRNNVIRVARIADQGPQDPRSLGCPVQCTMYITFSRVGDTMMFNQTF